MAETKVIEGEVITTKRDRWLKDLLDSRRDETKSLYRALSGSVKQRVAVLQDIANVSLAVLGGIISLAVFANGHIKTHILFNSAGFGLVICILSAFALRLYLIKFWEDVLWVLAEREIEVWDAIGNMKYHNTHGHDQASERLKDVMTTEPPLPHLPWQASLPLVSSIIILFLASLVFLGLSLLLHITTK